MKKNLKNWYMTIKDKLRDILCKNLCGEELKYTSSIEKSYLKNANFIFFNLTKELSELQDESAIYRKIGEAILKIFNCDEIEIYKWNEEKEGFVLESFFVRENNKITMPYNFIPLSYFPRMKDITTGKRGIVSGWELLEEGSQFYTDVFDFASSLIGPFYERDRFKGIVFIIWKKKKIKFTEYEKKIFDSILNHLSNSITQSALYKEVLSLATIDRLTGLYNRRFFDETLEREYERVKRYNRKLSLVMFDINRFKYINDNFGHLVGDMVLREVSKIIKENIRSTDVAVRYGGDEIVLILPETHREDAKVVIDKILKKIKEWNFTRPIDGFNGDITLSVGCADTDEVHSAEELISLADKRMYEDKRRYYQSIDS